MLDQRLFTAFNFRIHIQVDAPGFPKDLCEAAFAECDGLEVTMEAKTFQEGGNNTRQIHLAGPVSYSQLSLKRGMTADTGLWRWFAELMKTDGRRIRAQASVVMLAADGSPQATFVLVDCLPVKLKAAPLNAAEGLLAIEELQIAYAGLDLKSPAA